MAKKTTCPITRTHFEENAEAIPIKIGNDEMEADVKFFSTGSLGWYLNGKTKIEIGGVKVPVQIGLSLTIVGSKELPREEKSSAEESPAEESPAEESSAEE